MLKTAGTPGWTTMRSGVRARVKPCALSSAIAVASALRALPRLVRAAWRSKAEVAAAMVPRAVEPGGGRPSVGPAGGVVGRVTLPCGTLPTFVRVMTLVTGAPGVVLSATGVLVTVMASTAGMVNVSVSVSVIVGAVVLVAV